MQFLFHCHLHVLLIQPLVLLSVIKHFNCVLLLSDQFFLCIFCFVFHFRLQTLLSKFDDIANTGEVIPANITNNSSSNNKIGLLILPNFIKHMGRRFLLCYDKQ